jgi:hypothetical protein
MNIRVSSRSPVPSYPVRSQPEWFARPYLEAFDQGDAALIRDGMDRAYGRPVPTAVSQDFGEIDPGDVVEIRRLLIEAISVERAGELPGDS